MADNPLGRHTHYPVEYAPDVLFAIAREAARSTLSLDNELPFDGVDVWNAWELTWLDDARRPRVAVATLTVPATSSHLVESKSLKLYLNSFAQSSFTSADVVRDTIATDVGRAVRATVDVSLAQPEDWATLAPRSLPGHNIDESASAMLSDEVDPDALTARDAAPVDETLSSNVLRSLCPVTGQPDTGSVVVSYRGAPLDRDGLFRYIASFRSHTEFHEACVERMFVDIKTRCACDKLTVAAYYNRRGGIDINPLRSDADGSLDALRAYRQ